MSNSYFDPNNYYADEANGRANAARLNEDMARQDLQSQQFQNQSNSELIAMLRNANQALQSQVYRLESDCQQLKVQKDFLDHLLSQPLPEIANHNESFKASYEAQQLVLAKWILSQKAYAETALCIGIQAGKSEADVLAVYKDSLSSVLANATKHGNNAVTSQVLKDNWHKLVKAG